MNQAGQMTAALANETSGTNVSTRPEGSCAHFMDAGVGPEPRMPGTRGAQFVYIIQNSISLQD